MWQDQDFNDYDYLRAPSISRSKGMFLCDTRFKGSSAKPCQTNPASRPSFRSILCYHDSSVRIFFCQAQADLSFNTSCPRNRSFARDMGQGIHQIKLRHCSSRFEVQGLSLASCQWRPFFLINLGWEVEDVRNISLSFTMPLQQ